MVWPPSGNRFSEIVRDMFEDTLDPTTNKMLGIAVNMGYFDGYDDMVAEGLEGYRRGEPVLTHRVQPRHPTWISGVLVLLRARLGRASVLLGDDNSVGFLIVHRPCDSR